MAYTLDDLELAQEAALAGAAEGLRHFAALAGLPRELKQDGSVVTAADRAVEDRIRDVLTGARPADTILGEEHGETAGQGGRRWIIDPIDGTHLFVEGDDRWLVLIALEEQGEITVGVAALPAQGLIFWAVRGDGARQAAILDGRITGEQKIAVAGGAPELASSRLGVVPDWDRDDVAALIGAADELPWSLHPGLLVARGDLDVAVQTSGKIWDFAATSLIVTEAGGDYRGLDGRTTPGPGASLYSRSAEIGDAALAVLR
ncbi:inositol monophosphatase family protein [Actinoplanes xinjiangensis]|uniref:Histidinol-phosphatase n=1 Tax=Actinoplanes xinjiangensis TaxID=512350 RepID=A0A316FV74_9ACTN|nr:inositol monophosphatase family protein [Actinoplanes xinjiangensis]PWK52333.1 histidinol-phosphatase [Actinoplanes xinjiangensis]GIF36967.1 histidinol-phosphatase [Actinoplanes xinjiangensis]